MKLYFDLLITIGIVATALPALILLYSRKNRKSSWEYKRPHLTLAIAIVLFIGTATLLYGSFIESRLIITNHVTVDLAHVEKPIRAVVVADYQVGPYKKTDYVQKSVDQILSLEPEVVFIVGDQVDNTGDINEEVIYLKPLEQLVEAGIPTFAVHGNHEHGIGGGRAISDPRFRVADVTRETKEAMEALGIRYLVNEVEEVTIDDQSFYVYGSAGWWGDFLSFDALEERTKDIDTIALIHNPAATMAAAEQDIDLMLAGHTHGGQIRLPLIGPIGIVDNVVPRAWYQGLHDVDTMKLFVTSGIGETGTRARLFNPPEIVALTLE